MNFWRILMKHHHLRWNCVIQHQNLGILLLCKLQANRAVSSQTQNRQLKKRKTWSKNRSDRGLMPLQRKWSNRVFHMMSLWNKGRRLEPVKDAIAARTNVSNFIASAWWKTPLVVRSANVRRTPVRIRRMRSIRQVVRKPLWGSLLQMRMHSNPRLPIMAHIIRGANAINLDVPNPTVNVLKEESNAQIFANVRVAPTASAIITFILRAQ